MDEKKKLQRVGLAVAGIILLVAGLWFLFGNVDTNTGHRDNVESGFDDLDREQQEAAASLETVRDRAADSQQSVERIAGSIDESQNAAERIERANSELASSIDSITERNRDAAAAIDAAESGNRNAAAELERAATGVRECERINNASEQILAKYTRGIPQE